MSLEIATGDSDISQKKKSQSLFEGLFETERTRMFIMAKFEKYRDRINMDTLRPLPVFLGVTGQSFCFAPDAFTPPSKKMDKSTIEKVTQRVNLNIAYFLTNYALIAAGTCVVVILMHPIMIIFSTIVYAFWKVHSVMVKDSVPLIIMEKDVGQYLTVEVRTKILYIITLWVVACYCLTPFLLATSLTALMVFTHAVMRDPKQVESGRGLAAHKDNDSDDENDDSSGGSEVMVEKMDSKDTV